MRAKTEFIVVHCSATRPSSGTTVETIRRYHMEVNRWSDIGYHFVIERDGSIRPGRNLDSAGAHVNMTPYGGESYNGRSVGVCLIGGLSEAGVPTANYTTRQYANLRILLAGLQARYPGSTVCGHRNLSPDLNDNGKVEANEYVKDCPCFDVIEWYSLPI